MSFITINENILSSVKDDNFAGYDPFDFLNSSLIDKINFNKNKLSRLILLQTGKHLPFNIRPYIGIPKLRNPKGIALFILGMLEDYERSGDVYYLNEATSLADWLLTQRSDPSVWRHSCWGYHFDWQARAFFVPKGKPNIITTCYVARALYALGRRLECNEYVEVALDSARFIHKSLLTKVDDKIFFAYIPGEAAFVHNASLWGAAWVAKAGIECNDDKLKETALLVARQSVKEQRDNGSWTYGTLHHHQFVDGFHTGYNLEALNSIRHSLNTNEFDSTIANGLHYYKNNFFLDNGTAKYYDKNTYPLDMHSFSQAIVTLLKVDISDTNVALVEKVANRALEDMYLPKEHRFIYQRHQFYANKVNYIRWTQAWSYYGFALFNNYMDKRTYE